MAEKAPDATRWQGFTHKELYKLLHEGRGPAASADPSRRWAEISGTLTEVGQDLRHAVDKSKGQWSGPAAGAAYDSLAGLIDWAQQTANRAAAMRQSVENQADYLARARADMPVPEDTEPATAPDPTGGAAQQVIAAQRDLEPVEASSSTGAQRAFEVMTAYQRNTTTNTTGMAAFTAPAELHAQAGVNRHQRGGIVLNTPIVSVEISAPAPVPEHDHGHHHGRHDSTTGARFEGDAVKARPGPGSFTVASPAGQPFLGLAALGLGSTIGWSDADADSGSGSRSGGGGSSAGSGRGGATSVGVPGSGVPSSGVPGSGGGTVSGHGIGSAAGPGPHSADIQSAAAGQAAAAAGTPAAATPGAAAGTGSSGTAGSTDPRALRRFGVESAIGSGQWFGDSPDYEIRGASPGRRRDLTQPAPVTESVSIDGEEHHLPHTVIGDGPG